MYTQYLHLNLIPIINLNLNMYNNLNSYTNRLFLEIISNIGRFIFQNVQNQFFFSKIFF